MSLQIMTFWCFTLFQNFCTCQCYASSLVWVFFDSTMGLLTWWFVAVYATYFNSTRGKGGLVTVDLSLKERQPIVSIINKQVPTARLYLTEFPHQYILYWVQPVCLTNGRRSIKAICIPPRTNGTLSTSLTARAPIPNQAWRGLRAGTTIEKGTEWCVNRGLCVVKPGWWSCGTLVETLRRDGDAFILEILTSEFMRGWSMLFEHKRRSSKGGYAALLHFSFSIFISFRLHLDSLVSVLRPRFAPQHCPRQ